MATSFPGVSIINFLSNRTWISYVGCILQIFFQLLPLDQPLSAYNEDKIAVSHIRHFTKLILAYAKIERGFLKGQVCLFPDGYFFHWCYPRNCGVDAFGHHPGIHILQKPFQLRIEVVDGRPQCWFHPVAKVELMRFLVVRPVREIIVSFLVGIGCWHYNYTRHGAIFHIVFAKAAVSHTVTGLQHQRIQREYDISIASDVLLVDCTGVAIVWPVVPVVTMVVCIVVFAEIEADAATSDFVIDYL